VNGTQITILVTYSIIVVLAVAVAVAFWATTRRRPTIDVHRLAELEKNWLGIVVVILVGILAATIWFTPYGKSTPPGAQVVKVDASQFFWKISPRRVTVRRPVAFVTRASDVNHGFGIFRGRKLIAQIQVVPDRDSTLIHTFTKPGTYTVLCLEFCGVGHDRMDATFQVTP
jgi:cytochrome c oxidase subunit II